MAASLPLMVRLDGRSVLVVGGGAVGTAKARMLQGCGARVTLVAPWFCAEARALEGVERLERRYRPADLAGRWLVVTAVDDESVSAAVAADAEAARIFCNAADRPPYCSVTLMATHRDGEVTVAVSTDGASPAAASWLRDRLAESLGGRGGRLVRLASQARQRLRQHRSSEGLPWPALFEQLMQADDAAAEQALDAFVDAARGSVIDAGAQSAEMDRAATASAVVDRGGFHSTGPADDARECSGVDAVDVESLAANRRRIAPSESPEDLLDTGGRGLGAGSVGAGSGSVLLVGAGPGDARLLTVAALEAIAAADVVVHDALVSGAVLATIPAAVERIDVGKRPGRPVPQELIGALLVTLARDGRRVVRLKGGDPYLFGRGGEEALVLRQAGIAFEVIPGVSSALAAPALAGIPVTHRGAAAAVTVVTGHRAAEFAAVDWAALARFGGTIVVLMGVTGRAAIADALCAGGLAADTPVAVIERAGHAGERVVRTVLAELGATAVSPPAVLVIGAVAGLDLRSVVSDVSTATDELAASQQP